MCRAIWRADAFLKFMKKKMIEPVLSIPLRLTANFFYGFPLLDI